MVPRLHKRGMSFKGVCTYVLSDAGKEENRSSRPLDRHT